MRLAAWRDTWMWLAVSACGGAPPSWMSAPGPTKVSIYDAAPLAGATYIATVDNGGRGDPGLHVRIERGSFQCRQLVGVLDRGGPPDEALLQQASKNCDPELAKLLRQQGGFVFVMDGKGKRWLSAADVLAAAAPIDSPAKALLAVWVGGKYELGWSDGSHGYGNLEDGRVRAVAGGFEVAGGTSKRDTNCGGSKARETVTNYRVTLFVATTGEVTVRDQVETHRYDVADPCHPHGRRPADFVDVASGGTLRGHLRRAMHHEAESVRAFVRIERELRAHGAPEELCAAAAQAAQDERDHAARYARLLGEDVAISEDALPVRGLVDLAIDNASEGCIGEAYAALATVVQAQTVEDAALREHFTAIATDELAHAALACAIATWLDGVLSPDERARVRAARDAAVRTLRASFATYASEDMLGLPIGEVAVGLLDCVVAASR